MGKRLAALVLVAVVIGLVALAYVASGNSSPQTDRSAALTAGEGGDQAGSDDRAFKLCDGETEVVISVPSAEKTGKMSREVAEQVAARLMQEWTIQKRSQGDRGSLLLAHKGEPHSRREMRTWDAELDKAVKEGYRLFHDSSLGTNGISCDMCHPDADDTHPYTYPKFQTQLKQVALLRDMINWCIENPLEGKRLADDDPRMKALEMYILWANKGEVAVPGKH
jgi:thiosulfate dehydrogenase